MTLRIIIPRVYTAPQDRARRRWTARIRPDPAGRWNAYLLDATPDTPSRTLARDTTAPVVYRTTPLVCERPDLRAALARAPERVIDVPMVEATRYVELARGCMLTRQRDLAAFSWGDARDVRVVDDGEGPRYVLIGTLPSRWLPLLVVHGRVMLRNGVPVGLRADGRAARRGGGVVQHLPDVSWG